MNINNETVFRANAIVPTCIQSLSHLLPHPPTWAMLLLPISLRNRNNKTTSTTSTYLPVIVSI